LDEPDLGVDALELGVGQAELDRGDDRFEVFLIRRPRLTKAGMRLRFADVHHRVR
jgi:hypothetical protein